MFLPFTFTVKELSATFFQNAAFMEQDRVELSTPALSERCSNQLSYCPKVTEISEKGRYCMRADFIY